jgi:hypothetical protein
MSGAPTNTTLVGEVVGQWVIHPDLKNLPSFKPSSVEELWWLDFSKDPGTEIAVITNGDIILPTSLPEAIINTDLDILLVSLELAPDNSLNEYIVKVSSHTRPRR